MDFLITSEDAGIDIRRFISSHVHLSSKMLKALKYAEDGILVNGERRTVRYLLKEGDLLSLAIDDRESAEHLEAVELPLAILYEDADLVVPSKPSNMPTHPSHNHHRDTVANALAFRYAQMGQPFVFRPINRLDRNTSGLLLVARNRLCAGRLSRAMQEGKIQKSYLAILVGEMPLGKGKITEALCRTEESIILRRVCPPDTPGADHAVTEYEVLASQNGHTLVRAHPITGRTHQLRVHFAHLGHPILGDDLYGSPSPIIPRHALHALTLSFVHPSTKTPMTLSAPPPEDFAIALKRFFSEELLLELVGKDHSL